MEPLWINDEAPEDCEDRELKKYLTTDNYYNMNSQKTFLNHPLFCYNIGDSIMI